MIVLTPNQLEKLELIDKLFSALDTDDIRRISEAETIVSKIKGTQEPPNLLLSKLVMTHNNISGELARTQTEMADLKNDFRILLDVLNKTVFSYNAHLNNLKQKHNIY